MEIATPLGPDALLFHQSRDGVTIKEETGVVRKGTQISVGKPGESETDPLVRRKLEGKALTVEGEADGFVGDDGNRIAIVT